MGNKTTYLNPPPGKVSYLARAVSNIINPVVAGVSIAGFTAFRAINDPLEAATWVSAMSLLTVIPPLSYIIYLVKTGYLLDIFMPDQTRRIKPVSFIVIWVIISAIILDLIGAPLAIILILIVTTVLIGSLLGITFIWKISFHTAIITTAATLTALQGVSQAWVFSLLVPLVGWSRVRLRRHTPPQVIAGAITGCLVAIMAYNFLQLYLNV